MLFVGFSCSSNQVDEPEDGEEISENMEDGDEEDADFVVDADDEELIEDEDEDEEVMEVAESYDEVPAISEEEVAMEESPMKEQSVAGSNGEYIVQEGDTLMYIAFKLFGDYRKWHQLKSQNAEAVNSGMPTGTVLSYHSDGFVWNHNGLPYLIKRGDTLGTISNDKYGTSQKWRNIWDNNKDMIQNPNLIFAGFTLYYVAERDLASE